MKRTILIVSIAVAVLALIAGVYWYFWKSNVKPADALNAIPHDAAIILEIRDFRKAWENYKQTATYRDELEKHETFRLFRDNVDFIDSLMKSNITASEIFSNRKMYISIHTAPEYGMEYLYCMSLEKTNMKAKLDELIKSVSNSDAYFRNFEYGNTVITGVRQTEEDSSFYYTQYMGVFIASYSLLLTESAIDRLNRGETMMMDSYFAKAVESSGKNVEVNIYINYARFPGYLKMFAKSENAASLESVSQLAEWSEVDLNLRPEGLMLNGFTYPNDTAAHYLNLFKVQKPQQIEFTSVLPSNTAFFMFFGIHDILSFYSDYKTYLKKIGDLERYEQEVKNINSTYNVDIEMSLFSWMGNEFGMCITEPRTTAFSENTYAVFKARRTDLASDLLADLVKSLALKQGEAEKEIYQDYTIININLPQVLPRLFGSTFEYMKSTYYTVLGDYVVFGNNMQSVKNFINYYAADKTLGKDIYFAAFSENISSTFNVFAYSSPPRSKYIFESYANRQTTRNLNESEESVKKFEGIAVQMSSNGSAFYTNVYMKYNADYSETQAGVFEARLDTTISAKPLFLKNSFSGENEVFVQDDANTVYLLNTMGNVLWKKQIPEKINGKVYQVDAYKNGKLQIVFATTNFIYMLDRKGENVGKFPLELESPATNPLSVFDYDNKRDYRMFIACKNKKVYCFDAKGEPVKGWTFNKSAENISQPIVHLRAANKDFLVIAENDGKMNILDRRGVARVKVKEKIPVSKNKMQVDVSSSGATVALTDSFGKIFVIAMDGKITNYSPKPFSPRHSFVYGDINSDNYPEFIIADMNEVQVFSNSGEKMFTYTADDDGLLLPMVADTWDGGRLGVLNTGSNRIFLFDESGNIHEDFPLEGSTLFDFSPGRNNIPSMLATGFGNSVMIYAVD